MKMSDPKYASNVPDYLKYEPTLVNGVDGRIRCMTGQEAANPTNGFKPETVCMARLEKAALAFADDKYRDSLTFNATMYEPFGRIIFTKGVPGINANAKVVVDFINSNARGPYAQAKDIVEIPFKAFADARIEDPRHKVTSGSSLKLTSAAAFDAGFTEETISISQSNVAKQPSKTRAQIEAIAAVCVKNKGIEAVVCNEAGVEFARIVNAAVPVPKQVGTALK